MLVSLLVSVSLKATEPLIKTSYVFSSGGESLRELLEQKVGISSFDLDQQGYYEKIKSWNPAIKDPHSLERGQRVYIELPYRAKLISRESISGLQLDKHLDKITTNDQALSDKNANSQTNKIVKKNQETESMMSDEQRQWNFSIFYALSMGTFEESIIDSNVATKSEQSSPYTLGLSASKRLNPSWNYFGSVYLSKLNAGLSEVDETVSLPIELGINSYIGYQRETWPLQLYAGFDYEKFSSYNTDELLLALPLEVRENTLTFLTLGASKSFEWFGKQFLAKASYSSSISSSQTQQGSESLNTFTGSKFIFYLNMKANKNWSYHTFYKQHDLDGLTALKISRAGLGVGYTF